MVRQTVSTILNKWKKRDIVDLKKRKIIILQPYILADIFLEVSD
jgi:CRP-like cAMP-binding protein